MSNRRLEDVFKM